MTSTCRGCGRPIRVEMSAVWETGEDGYSRRTGRKEPLHPNGGAGYGGNGHFCTLRCGFWWAVRKIEGE